MYTFGTAGTRSFHRVPIEISGREKERTIRFELNSEGHTKHKDWIKHADNNDDPAVAVGVLHPWNGRSRLIFNTVP